MNTRIHPIKLGVACCYVVQGEGTIMIDAGSPHQATHFRKAMETLQLDPRSIRLIVITHGHWDHIGSAKDIKEITGAKIAMHYREKDWLEKSMKVLPLAFRAIMTIFLPLVRFPATKVDVVLGDRGVPWPITGFLARSSIRPATRWGRSAFCWKRGMPSSATWR